MASSAIRVVRSVRACCGWWVQSVFRGSGRRRGCPCCRPGRRSRRAAARRCHRRRFRQRPPRQRFAPRPPPGLHRPRCGTPDVETRPCRRPRTKGWARVPWRPGPRRWATQGLGLRPPGQQSCPQHHKVGGTRQLHEPVCLRRSHDDSGQAEPRSDSASHDLETRTGDAASNGTGATLNGVRHGEGQPCSRGHDQRSNDERESEDEGKIPHR